MRIRIKKLVCIVVAFALMFALLPVFTVPALAAEYWESWTELPTTAGGTLSGNYKVTSNRTITNSSTGGNGLVISGTVTIYIKSGYTLTVNGGGGSGTTGGGAGIRLPSGATLIIRGDGKLIAKGGAGGNGGSGGAGSAGTSSQSGAGGNGGAGGGGAGAGIGTSGGAGKSSATNGGAAKAINSVGAGNAGTAGSAGSTAAAMGTLYVLDTVTVTATGGSAGNTGSPGNGSSTGYATNAQGAAGGGGGGGGNKGGAGAAIGRGGSGGGNGGGGGSGGVGIHNTFQGVTTQSASNGSGTSGGVGGKAVGSHNGEGGAGASGGTAGATGATGTVNKASSATVSGGSATAVTTYTLTYNANGGSLGSVPSSQTFYSGATNYVTGVSPSARTGYNFLGWSTSNTATSASYTANSSISISKNTTLYAVWKADTYSVTFYANGGSGAPSSQTKTHGTTLTLSSTKPSFTGWTFKGWATSQSNATAGIVSYASGASYSSNAAQDLYAVWQRTITLNNQSATTGGTASVTATYKAALPSSSITVPTKTDYTFGGYYTNTNGSGTRVYSSTGARVYSSAITNATTIPATLYAYWVENPTISGSVTIEYTYQQGDDTIEVPNDGSSRATSAVVQLQRKISGASNYTHVATQTVSFNIDGDSDTQSYEFTDQPAIDTSGNAYEYIVTTELSNYNVSYSGNDITLTFNPNSFDAQFEITPGGSNPPPSINLKILYRNPGDTESEGAIISQHLNTYVTAELKNGKYTGSYPVWRYDGNSQAYTYQLVLLPGQGLANVTYGNWIYWNGSQASGTMTATFVSKRQTVVNDNTDPGSSFEVVESNLDEIFDRIVKPADMPEDKVVTLALNVSDINVESNETEEIRAAAGNGSEVYFFDATLTKTVDGSGAEILTDLSVPVEIHIALTGDLAGRTYYRVYRYHNGVAEQLSSDPKNPEHFIVDVQNSEIIIYTKKFSTYAIFGNDASLNFEESGAVDVQAKITGKGGAVYKIDLAWGAMAFEYSTSGVWDPDTHSYKGGGEVVGWIDEGFHGGNNKITAYNRSNADLRVSFDVVSELEGVDMVVNAQNSDTASAAIDLPLYKVPNEGANAPSVDAYLRLSGTPKDTSITDNYSKAGVITVTLMTVPDSDKTPIGKGGEAP